MNRIDRLMGIITVLQSRRHHSVEDLSAQFGISVRTVYRDLSALGEIGVPVTFEPGKGYGLVQGFFLPPVVFTNEEANALALVEALVMRFGDRGVQKHYASALTKVRAVLRGDQKDQAEELRDHLKAMRPHCLNDDYDHLARIQQSIAERHLLWIAVPELRRRGQYPRSGAYRPDFLFPGMAHDCLVLEARSIPRFPRFPDHHPAQFPHSLPEKRPSPIERIPGDGLERGGESLQSSVASQESSNRRTVQFSVRQFRHLGFLEITEDCLLTAEDFFTRAVIGLSAAAVCFAAQCYQHP